jgi:hypothetical protein
MGLSKEKNLLCVGSGGAQSLCFESQKTNTVYTAIPWLAETSTILYILGLAELEFDIMSLRRLIFLFGVDPITLP